MDVRWIVNQLSEPAQPIKMPRAGTAPGALLCFCPSRCKLNAQSFDGGREGTRTSDLHDVNVAL